MGEGLQWDDVIDALFGEGIDTVEQAFKFIDTDGSGTISHEELLAAVQTLELKGTTEELPRQPLLLESGKLHLYRSASLACSHFPRSPRRPYHYGR